MKHTEAPTRKKMGFYIRLWRPVGGLDKKDFSRAWKNTSCALFISTKTDRRSFRNGGFFEYHTLYIKWPASCMAHPGRQKRRRISAEKERFRYNIIESISNTLATNARPVDLLYLCPQIFQFPVAVYPVSDVLEGMPQHSLTVVFPYPVFLAQS